MPLCNLAPPPDAQDPTVLLLLHFLPPTRARRFLKHDILSKNEAATPHVRRGRRGKGEEKVGKSRVGRGKKKKFRVIAYSGLVGWQAKKASKLERLAPGMVREREASFLHRVFIWGETQAGQPEEKEREPTPTPLSHITLKTISPSLLGDPLPLFPLSLKPQPDPYPGHALLLRLLLLPLSQKSFSPFPQFPLSPFGVREKAGRAIGILSDGNSVTYRHTYPKKVPSLKSKSRKNGEEGVAECAELGQLEKVWCKKRKERPL